MLMKKLVSAAPVGLKCGTHEGLPGFIFLGFIFYRGFIYLLRIYWELLAVSVFQRTLILTLAPALVLTLTKSSPSPSLSSHPQELCGTYFKMYEDLLKNPNKPQKKIPVAAGFF